MSKFDEMCAAYASLKKDWIDYHNRCVGHYSKLVNGFQQYCEIPQTSFEIVPANADPKPGTTYSIPGEIYFDSESRFWQLAIVITLQIAQKVLVPRQRIRMVICLMEKAGKVYVKYDSDGDIREVDIKDEKQCQEFYDFMVNRVKRFFTYKMDDYLDGSAQERTIGFTAPSPDDVPLIAS